jgi:hypothetical protein
MGIEILTHYNKLHRVARQIDDIEAFHIIPGQFVQLLENERVQNVEPVLNSVPWVKLCLGSMSVNEYESNDVRGIGRIACVEDIGVRVKLTRDLYFGNPSNKLNGAPMVVQTGAGDQCGFLHFIDETSIVNGKYPQVAIFEGYYSGIGGSFIVVKITEQETYTKS